MKFDLFIKKPLHTLQMEAQGDEDGKGLKKTLTAFNLTMLGIGAVIGAGIFVLTGNAAAQYAGPSIVISFIISGLACAFAGLCYAEFAAMIPIAGSAYTYAYATLGELIAWIIGWDLILEYMFAASTVAVGWSGYVTNFLKENLKLEIPSYLTNSPILYDVEKGWISTGSFINFPAVFIVVLVSTLLVIGIRESVKFNNVIVIIKVVVILLFIAFGASYITAENLTPFIPENDGTFGHFGWSGILRGAGVIFFSYIGFDAVSTAAQEAKNPQRDMPIGILASLAVCTIIYILVALVLTGIIKYDQLNSPNPIAVAIDSVGGTLAWLSPLIKLGAIAGLSSVVLVMLMGQPRIFYSMSKDGLLPPLFSKLHSKFKTPYISTIITGFFASLLAGFLPISLLGELVSIGTLLAFAIVCIGVMVLRVKQPNANRPFKAPFIWVTGTLGAAFAFIQMLGLPADTWIRLIIWMALGFLIYFLYGKFNSVLQKKNAE
ncbi:MAG: amino acid permease [Bacteroidetes bacterium]|nr:MAG: amino acid permease [Bacteroidota bacterium]